jgi:hypothetical protein
VRGRRLSVGAVLAPLDDRMVFVFGSPRSGTTFLARAIGSCPGFVDLGEVAPLKAAIPELVRLESDGAAARIMRILTIARRLGLAGGLRAVEQTPETAFIVEAVVRAFPQAKLIHIMRDGRDVVGSLLDRGWLRFGKTAAGNAGQPFGSQRRFWVEPARLAEFEAASEVRRAAWAWRRYVIAGRSAGPNVHEVRYERLTADYETVAAGLARHLEIPPDPLARALSAVHGDSVGRFRRELSPGALAEVDDEAGPLLRALGYLQ